jgi:hypothetical protein
LAERVSEFRFDDRLSIVDAISGFRRAAFRPSEFYQDPARSTFVR